jgi:hypothetical protein
MQGCASDGNESESGHLSGAESDSALVDTRQALVMSLEVRLVSITTIAITAYSTSSSINLKELSAADGSSASGVLYVCFCYQTAVALLLCMVLPAHSSQSEKRSPSSVAKSSKASNVVRFTNCCYTYAHTHAPNHCTPSRI